MKKTRVVIPALALIAFSTAASITGTVAWFSANQTVKVGGMTVTTKVSDNLLIAASNSSDNNYSSSNLVQERTAKLEPVSTVDGESFFYHGNNNLNGNGAATDSTYVAYDESTDHASKDTAADKEAYDAAFQTRYSVDTPITTANVVYGYVDYNFYLKATSSTNGSKLALSQVNLMYNNAAIAGTEKAWRVAVFTEEVAKEAAGSSLTKLSILTLAGAANSDAGKAASATNARTAVTYNEAALIDNALDAGATQRYRIRVRLWLEGEDTTCNNETYANLTSSWKLELKFDLSTTAAGATNIVTNTTILGA